MAKNASEPGQGRAGERGKSLGVRGVVYYWYSDYHLLYCRLSSAYILPRRARIKWVLGSKKTIKKTRSSGSGLMSAPSAQKKSRSLALTLSAHSAGMRIVTYGPASAENQILVDFPLRETGKSKGDSASCGMRLRALP